MPWPAVEMSISKFEAKVKAFKWNCTINGFHVHHTFRPSREQWEVKGSKAVAKAMFDYHTTVRKWSDFGQHITVMPDGTIWTGRSWNRSPASAIGHNGSNKLHPFMFEAVGDLRRGKEYPPPPAQWDSMLRSCAAILRRFGLSVETIRFHKQMQNTACPGDIDRAEFLSEVAKRMDADADAMMEPMDVKALQEIDAIYAEIF